MLVQIEIPRTLKMGAFVCGFKTEKERIMESQRARYQIYCTSLLYSSGNPHLIS